MTWWAGLLKAQVAMLPAGELCTLLQTVSWNSIAAKARNLSQFSHGLTGPDGTTASIPDIWKDPDLRIWIPAHWLDTSH